jgi:hypothetical protein
MKCNGEEGVERLEVWALPQGTLILSVFQWLAEGDSNMAMVSLESCSGASGMGDL